VVCWALLVALACFVCHFFNPRTKSAKLSTVSLPNANSKR
jgi:hypothetical protein